jgi:hypothetical protein
MVEVTKQSCSNCDFKIRGYENDVCLMKAFDYCASSDRKTNVDYWKLNGGE